MKASLSTPPRQPGHSAEPQRRVDVVVAEDENGRRQVVLRDLSLGHGVGWYAQKTIRLDPEQVDALMRALCCAKQSCALRHDTSSAGSAQILQLSPNLRDD